MTNPNCSFPGQLPRAFPDHAIRAALIQPRNLRAVLREVAAEMATRPAAADPMLAPEVVEILRSGEPTT